MPFSFYYDKMAYYPGLEGGNHTNKKILADLHTHTLFSQHAFSTLRENIVCAQREGMQYPVITDYLYYPNDRMQALNEIHSITDISGFSSIEGICLIGGIEGKFR